VFGLAAALLSAWHQDETYDEPDHLAYARRLVETGETERLSVLHYNSKTPGTVPNAVARQLAKKWLGVRDAARLRFVSRLPTVATLALLFAAVWAIGRRFLGERAADLATIACALDANLVANASVVTVDVAFALATLLTLGAVLWMAERPSIARAAAVGAALGLAFAVKFSAFLLVPAVAVLPFLVPALRARLWTRRTAAGAAAAVAVLLVVIGAAYRFHDVGVEWNDVGWRSPPMLRVQALVPHLRLPVPADFATGFDLLAVAVEKDYPVVLLGRHYPRGVWFYFLAVWLVKTPVLLIAAIVHGIARTVSTKTIATSPPLCYLALTVAVFLAYFSFFFTAQVGFRFVLMCVPLLALLAAAGLAPLAASRRVRALGVLVVLTATGENAAYLGNHLAFTNAAVWPKREAFRLVTNANIDWGQNDEKIAGWLAARGLAARRDPVHALPGDNVFDLNRLAGVGKFRQHLWLREHVSPRAHFGHTYLWFVVDPSTYDRMMEEDRHLRPSDAATGLCAEAAPAGAIADGGPAVMPELSRTQGLVLCVTASDRVDLGLRGDEGTIAVGPAGEPLRDQPLLRPGQETWYRLDPGTNALAAFWATGFRGRWALRTRGRAAGATVALATRRVAVDRGAIADRAGPTEEDEGERPASPP
jgi:dolichyl-phosphate-mannose-protein mannosyltransferase